MKTNLAVNQHSIFFKTSGNNISVQCRRNILISHAACHDMSTAAQPERAPIGVQRRAYALL